MEQHTTQLNLSTSSSKEIAFFFGKMLLFAGLVILFMLHVMPQFAGNYTAALIDKAERLRSTDGARIVLIGDSNLVFGMDSQLLEEKTGMPVVNMGLHGGIGNAVHEEMGKFRVNPGDIYVLSYVHYSDNDKILDIMPVWTAIEDHFDLWQILRLKDSVKMLRGFPIYFKKCMEYYETGTGNMDYGGVYSRNNFNEYGDMAAIRTETEYSFEEFIEAPELNATTRDRLNRLNQYLAQRGATLVIAAHPVGYGPMTADKEEFSAFQEQLEAGVDCDVISDFTEYLMDYSYFYDTQYHLTTEGAQIRTEKLAEDLLRWGKTHGYFIQNGE